MREGVDLIGLSGLITPSLDEMVHVAREMQRQDFDVPLLIGGATTSAKHTAVKIAPAYHRPTVHVLDASRCVGRRRAAAQSQIARAFDAATIAPTQAQLVESYQQRQEVHAGALCRSRRRPFADRLGHACGSTSRRSWACACWTTCRWRNWLPFIDWSPFFMAWELRGKYPADLRRSAVGMAVRVSCSTTLRHLLRGYRRASNLLEPAEFTDSGRPLPMGDDIVLYTDDTRDREIARFHTLRQQWERKGQKCFHALADFIAPLDSGRP